MTPISIKKQDIPKILLIVGAALILAGIGLWQVREYLSQKELDALKSIISCPTPHCLTGQVYRQPYLELGNYLIITGVVLAIAGSIPIVYNIGNTKRS
jgi:hypothetical protein